MIKKLISLTILLLIFLFTNVNLSFAQDIQTGKILKMRCLDAETVKTDDMAYKHNTPLSGAGFEPNSIVQIWRKVEKGFQCAVDKNGVSTCGADAPLAPIANDFRVVNFTKDEIKADSNGNVKLDKVHSVTKKRQDHYFYGVQEIDTLPTTTASDPIEPNSVALKLTSFTAANSADYDLEANNCVTVFFDPYGRIFDSISLEPISKVRVTLLDDAKNLIPVQPGVHENPSITEADGAFSFIVENGTYYLSPEKTSFIYPLETTLINSLVNKQTIYTDLYAGEPIVQKGEIQHRDIPMEPIDNNNPTNNPPEITQLLITPLITAEGSFQKVYGVVSHPRSIIRVYSGVRLVLEEVAKDNGQFELLINNNLIDQDTDLDVQAEKVDLLNSKTTVKQIFELIFKPVLAETVKTSAIRSISPVPPYLIGLVYDNEAKIMTAGTIEIIIPEMNNQIYSITKINENGTVYVSSNKIPPTTYILKIKDKKNNTISTISPKDFISKNKSFLDTEKINLFDSESASKAATVITKATNIPKTLNLYDRNEIDLQRQQKIQDEEKKNLNYILLTILILLSLGLLLFFLYRTKQKSNIFKTQ